MAEDPDVGSILQDDDADETGRLIRPYAMTGGRTGTWRRQADESDPFGF